jgi:hypothetical protein
MGLRLVGYAESRAYWKEVRSLERCPRRGYWDSGSSTLSLFLLPGHQEVDSFAPPHTLCHDVLPRHRPKEMELSNPGLKSLKP